MPPLALRLCAFYATFVALLVQLARSQSPCIVTAAGPVNIEGAPATTATLWGPSGVASDGAGGVYISDTASHTVRRYRPNGTLVLSAGTYPVPG